MKKTFAVIIVAFLSVVAMGGEGRASNESSCTEKCMLHGNNCRVDCYTRHRGDSTEKTCVFYCSRLQNFCEEDCGS